MRDEVRREVMQRLVAAIEDPGSAIRRQSVALTIDRYVDPRELEREREVLFAKRPIAVAHISELAGPGAYVTEELAGVPLVVVRESPRTIRAFVNACRHRGARLLTGARGACGKLLTCPYHGWSYRLDGSLFKITHEEVFDALDRDALGLREVPVEVRHGLVWASLGGGLDVASFLGPTLDEDFAAFGLERHRVMRRTTRVTRANWKLVMDAFAEGYHLETLHARSLARFFLPIAIVDDCAPHVRQVGARKSLMQARAESTCDLREHTTVFYDVFPNTVLVFHPSWISALTLFPEAVDRVRVEHRMLVEDLAIDDERREKLERSFEHIDGSVFEREDLAIAESVQSTLASGVNREIVLGGLEEGMRLFHAARDAALAGSTRPLRSATERARAPTVDYDDIADSFDERYHTNRYDGLERELTTFAAARDLRVLEAGCGTGHWLALCASGGASVAGVDPSAEMLARARARVPEADLALGRAEALPWSEGSFDRVVCINAVHHFEDGPRFIREARRVLVAGGGLAIMGLDPHGGLDRWWIYDAFPGTRERDQARYPPAAELRTWMREAGFRRVETHEAQHIELVAPAREAHARGYLDKSSTSQLVLLSDDEFRAGIAHILEREAILTIDLRLWATIGWMD